LQKGVRKKVGLPKNSDIVIIGGGLLGTSTAYQLARSGAEVTLVERHGLGREASGTSWGFVWIQTQPAGPCLDLALASSKMYRTLSDELEFDVEYTQCGGMIALEEEDDLEAAEIVVTNQKKAGVDIQLLDAGEVKNMEPALSESLAGAVYSSLDGKVNPIYLTFGLAEAARKKGAQIITHTEVQAIEVKKEQIQSVVTDRGSIQTHTIVNAAGAWAPLIGRMAGVDIPVVCHQGEVFVTESLPPLVSCLVYSGSCVRDLDRAMTGEPVVHQPEEDAVSGYGYVQHLSGNATFGAGTGPRSHLGADKYGFYKRIKELAIWGTSIIPALKDVSMIRSWTGLKPGFLPGVPDGTVVDQLEFRKSRMIVVLDTGHGVACCPMSGRLAAELITLGRENASIPASVPQNASPAPITRTDDRPTPVSLRQPTKSFPTV
jgi:sarcosine oxidase subunit beta